MNIQSSLLAAVDHVGEGITLSDPNADDHPLIYANEGFCRLTGYNSDEIIGRNCRFLQGEATSTDTVAQIRSCIANERSGIFEIYNYKKNGEGFWNSLSLHPIHHGKELAYYVGIQCSIHNQREAYDLLERQHDQLRDILSQFTDELRTSLKDISQSMAEDDPNLPKMKATLQQVGLLITMLETNSAEILDFVNTKSR